MWRGSPSYGLALGRADVGEHARDAAALVLRAPRQHRERRRVRHRDHVGLLDRVEAGDRGAVEAHAALEGVVELGGVDRERLQLPEDVGEPEADEADAALLDERLDVLGVLGWSAMARGSLDGPGRAASTGVDSAVGLSPASGRAQAFSSASAGASSRPISVSSYSTRAGESGCTWRSTIPRASSSFIRSDSSRSESCGIAWAISVKRSGRPEQHVR